MLMMCCSVSHCTGEVGSIFERFYSLLYDFVVTSDKGVTDKRGREEMSNMRVFIVLWLLASFYPSASYGQNKQNAGPSADVFLSVGGEVARPLKLSAADFAKLPRHKVRAKGHN